LPGQADGDVVTGPNIQLTPALQRTDADHADGAVVEFHRLQAQQRCYASGAADAEVDCLDQRQGLSGRVLPGCCPVRWFGTPALAAGALALAQYHTIGGEGQRAAVPPFSPAPGVAWLIDRLAVSAAVLETQLHQPIQALLHVGRAIGPIPDEQPDAGRLLR